MTKQPSNRWCILRTAGQRTLKLEAWLQDAGVEAWTPTEHIVRRAPRGGPVRTVVAPMAPTYVFARERHLAELQRLEGLDVRPCPAFSIFRYYGSTVFVRHEALYPLRRRQQDSYVASLPPRTPHHPRKEQGEPFRPGEVLTMSDGPFAGLECVVEDSDGRTTTLALTLFGRLSGMKMPTCELRREGVTSSAPAA